MLIAITVAVIVNVALLGLFYLGGKEYNDRIFDTKKCSWEK